MKRQLDRLKGKRLVTGDPNLMTKDEICINATPNGVEVKEIGTDGSIKDVASGGGGGDGVKEYYYRLNIDKINEDFPDYIGFGFMFGLGSYYIIIGTNNNNYNNNVYLEAPVFGGEIPEESIRTAIAVRVGNVPTVVTYNGDGGKVYPVYIYGDYYTRIYHMASFMGSSTVTIEDVKNMLMPYMTEITKEEYESLIEWPAIILGKE